MNGREGYRGVFRSTAMLGGARLVSMVLGMARSKLVALLLGPVGVGLLGTYEAVATMAVTIAGLGLGTSGVRQVAIASQDTARAARTIVSVNRLAFVSGILGTIATAALAAPISRYTFQDTLHTNAILLLSPTVALVVIACGRMAVVQGLGLTRHLAQNNLANSILGVAGSVALLAVLREDGIVPAVFVTSLATFIAAWWYFRRVELPDVRVTWRESLMEGRSLLQLGLAVMHAAFLSALVAYLARAVIARDIDMTAVGLYVCAYSLSGKLMGLLIDAMRTDFYPRISAAAEDDAKLNQVLNEQIEVALLLTTPGLLATIVFSPWLIRIFYSTDFLEANLLLRIFALGAFVSVVCGAIRMVQLAKARSLLCVATETGTNGLHIAMIFLLLKLLGLQGIAIAYLLHYLVQTVVSYVVARRLTGFRFTSQAGRTLRIFTAMAVATFLLPLLLEEWQVLMIGGVGCAVAGVYCLRQLMRLLGSDHRLAKLIAAQPVIGRLVAQS